MKIFTFKNHNEPIQNITKTVAIMYNTFVIDFFELSFLAEACIPPRPIARTCFWHKLIDTYYRQMSEEQRARLFEWITRKPEFDLTNSDCAIFAARYNPQNQYMVEVDYKGLKETHTAFLYNGKYHTGMNVWIDQEFIVDKYPVNAF